MEGKQGKDPLEIINNLAADDALSILKTLAGEDEQLAARIAELALAGLSGVDPEEVADVLYDELESLEVEEVWARAGQTRHGYVETGEAADEMVAELLEPYLDELRKYQKLGLPKEARQLCMGLLAGLYRFEHESKSEFKNWAPDSAILYAQEVIDVWKSGPHSRADSATVKRFVQDELFGWDFSLA